MKKQSLKNLTMFTFITTLFLCGLAVAAEPDRLGGREVSGTVKKINGNLVSVKTAEKTTRYFTLDELEGEGTQPLKPGDRVLLGIDKGNLIVDVQRMEESRLVTGIVETMRAPDKTATIRSVDGETQNFKLEDRVIPKMVALKEGVQVIFEIDGQNRVTDIHLD